MLSNSLIELDRAHLIHPVASWRGHEKAGVRMLTSAMTRYPLTDPVRPET